VSSSTIVGFTGTCNGMTVAQRASVVELMRRIEPHECHHGDCVGADRQFHEIARTGPRWMVGHPGPDEGLRANCDFDETKEVLSHLARNREIVKSVDVVIATPQETEHQNFGGTWYTIDHAIKKGRPVHVVWPDGRVETM
jgi:hypothetical protein